MIFHFTTKVFVSVFTVFSILSLTNELTPSQAQTTSPTATTFHCVTLDKDYATIARRGSKQTLPMLIWKSTIFGPQFTPQLRCKIVSDRLTQAVAVNGGKLSNLILKVGPLNRNQVVCYVRSNAESCNAANLIFTLSSSDWGNEDQVLQQLRDFSKKGSGPSSIRAPIVILLGEAIEKSLTGAVTTPASPARPPLVQPSQPAPSGMPPLAPTPDSSI
jgi:Circadian oscillating protein COP23